MPRITERPVENRTFSRKDTLTAKGAAICLLFFYHLFHEAETVDSLGVIYAPIPRDLFFLLSGFGNVCVAMFVFLSAHGISRQIHEAEQKMQEEKKEKGRIGFLKKKTWERFIRLMLRYIFVYVLSNLILFPWFDYKSLYGGGAQGILCMLTDMTGLAELLGTPTLNVTWWYMPLAYLLIFIVPVFYEFSHKTGWLLIPMGILLPMVLNVDKFYYMYFMVALWGICAARENWPDRIFAWRIPYWIKVVFSVLAVFISIFIRQNYLVQERYAFITEGIVAMLVCMAAAILLSNCPVLGKVMQFLGKYSMNMFLIHTFVYLMIFRDFIYSFRYSGLIWLVLLIVCLVVSVLMDFLYRMIKKLWLTFSKGML